ncbi:MAG: HD domain-containing protein [Thermotogaceae bacterium]|nr:HD domain-containing protein [Thermotogaceae bacterium]
MTEFLDFIDDKGSKELPSDNWKILVVEDDEDVQRLTELVLRDLEFDGKGIEILTAYSKEEAKKIFEKHDDIAVAIIDVVMEDKTAGLDLVKYIREDLKNRKTRLIIRTGQPGYAPKREVILNYDINDYREKTELSTEMMIGIVVTALRSYRDIINFEFESNLTENIFELSHKTTENLSQVNLVLDFLKNLGKVLKRYGIEINATVVDKNEESFYFGKSPPSMEDDYSDIKDDISWVDDSTLLVNLYVNKVKELTMVIEFTGKLSQDWKDKIAIHMLQVSTLISNKIIKDMINNTMYQMIFTLADLIEHRSVETGEHIRRVGEMSYALAKLYGMDENTAQKIKIASLLHDVGKIGIPDTILNKPSKLTEEEYEIMKTHTLIGYKILSKQKNEIFNLAAKIALYHHENWDGSGYPEGLSGEAIPLEARIVAIADNYDALISERIYRKAWPEDKVLEYIRDMRGIKFDPKITDLFFRYYKEITK